MPTSFTNAWLLQLLVKNLKAMLLLGLLFSVAAAVFSVLKSKTYQSSGLVYANHSNDIKAVAMNPAFGAEYQADKLVQLFHSQSMEDMLVERFDLVNYYELDTQQLNWKGDLRKQINADFKSERTAFLTIEVSAKAKDPELAAEMVNSMINYVDTIRKNVFHQNLHIYVNDLSQKVAVKEKVVAEKLNAIFNYTAPSKSQNLLAKQKQQAISNRREDANFVPGDAVIEEALRDNYSVVLEQMVDAYYLELGRYNELKRDLQTAQQKLSMPFPGVYKIRMAEPNYDPIAPKTVLNVVLGFVLGALLWLAMVVLKVRYNQLIEE